MFLPTRAGAEISTTTRSVHEGRHLEAVSERLAVQMDLVVEAGQPLGWAQERYRDELMKIIASERQALKSGERVLNKHYRPWAIDGGKALPAQTGAPR